MRGFVEIKIFDQNLTLLKISERFFLVIRQTEILLYLSQYLFGFCVFDSRKHRSPETFFQKGKSRWISEIFAENTVHYYKKANTLGWLYFYNFPP